MFKLIDNLLHQQFILKIHLYAPIANILLLLVQFSLVRLLSPKSEFLKTLSVIPREPVIRKH